MTYTGPSGTRSYTIDWAPIDSKQITIGSIKPGEIVSVTLSARNQNGVVTAPLKVDNLQNPNVKWPPQNLAGVVTNTPSGNVLQLTWSPVVGASSYDIEQNGQVLTLPSPCTNPSYYITNATAGTTYTFRVRSITYGTPDDWSSPAVVTVPAAPPVIPPVAGTMNYTYNQNVSISISTDSMTQGIAYQFDNNGNLTTMSKGTSFFSAPNAVTAVKGNGSATISFTAPTYTGGSTLASYTVTSSPGNITATGSGSPITVTGLTNGTTYTFTVVAKNATGDTSVPAVSNSVVPGP